MSEFSCRNGHLVRPSIGYCEECGGLITKMDGRSQSEDRYQERWERERFEAIQSDPLTNYDKNDVEEEIEEGEEEK